MSKKWKIFPVLIILLMIGFAAGAEDADESGFGFGFNLALGATTFTDDPGYAGESVTYQLIRLSPDISFGKFGLGLDIPLHFTFTGGANQDQFKVRKWDWVPIEAEDQSILDVYLPKFKYIRYGFKGEPLFVKLGSIDDATLGNGFIMLNYDNTLLLPEKRIFGMALDVDGGLFNFPLIGMESFVGNLARFDVIGGRLFVRPLVSTEIPIISALQVGTTWAVDRVPDLYNDVAGFPDPDPIVVYGVDFRLPILAKKIISLAFFGDYAQIGFSNPAGGTAVGFGGRLFGFLTYGAQLRFKDDNFVPNYFDFAYDLFRQDKYLTAQAGAAGEWGAGWLASLGTSFADDAFVFSVTFDGNFGPDPDPHLFAIIGLSQGVIPNLSFEAIYDKREILAISAWKDLLADAAMQARINYNVGIATISFIYQVRYDPTATPDPWVVSSSIESALQLF